MKLLTPAMASEDRGSVNLSQSRVARETGLNRPYFSQFESGRRVIEDHWLEKLHWYYASQGWATEQEPSKTPKKFVKQ